MDTLDSHNTGSAILQPVGWLGCRAPLEQFVELMVQRPVDDDGILDLSGTVIVLPGARAGRSITRMLVIACEHAGIPMCPPKVLTPGELEFYLRPPTGKPIANGIEWRLAVMQAIEEANPTDRARILPTGISGNESRGLAERMIGVQRELSVACIGWSQLAHAAEERDGDPERYRVFERIMNRSRSILNNENVQDPEQARESGLGPVAPLDLFFWESGSSGKREVRHTNLVALVRLLLLI